MLLFLVNFINWLFGSDYDKREKRLTTRPLVKMYAETYLDSSFQRKGGVEYGSGWSWKAIRQYATNYVRGRACNPIIVVHIDRALAFAIKQNDEESINYFRALKAKGYKYVSVDGNNSCSTISAFINGNSNVYLTDPVTKKKVFFSDLPEDAQSRILDEIGLNVIILREISKKEMCALFRDLNESTKLNAQEWRGAYPSKLSDYVREAANGNSGNSFFNRLFLKNTADADRRKHEEELARLALGFQNGTTSTRKKDLDSFYEDGFIDSGVITRVNSVLAELASVPKQDKKLKAGVLHTLFELTDVVISNHYTIKDPEQFYNWFLKRNRQELVKANKLPLSQISDAYSEWQRIHWDVNNRRKRVERISEIFNQDLDDLLKEGIIA